jgi:hypothetical protein
MSELLRHILEKPFALSDMQTIAAERVVLIERDVDWERLRIKAQLSSSRQNALTSYRVLETSTPLHVLHIFLRSAPRNVLSVGLRQSYGDHTRMLCLGIDRIFAGEYEWLEKRALTPRSLRDIDLAGALDGAREIFGDEECRAALGVAAALHDYGKLLARPDGLDSEDTVGLVAELIRPWRFDEQVVSLIGFWIRYHDLIEHVQNGEGCGAAILSDLDSLPGSLRPQALSGLGLIQVAGACSLGDGRLVSDKVKLLQILLADREHYLGLSPKERLDRLISERVERDDGFAFLATERIATSAAVSDRELAMMMDTVHLHGWARARSSAWTNSRPEVAKMRLAQVLHRIAECWYSGVSVARHILLVGVYPSVSDPTGWNCRSVTEFNLMSGRDCLVVDLG